MAGQVLSVEIVSREQKNQVSRLTISDRDTSIRELPLAGRQAHLSTLTKSHDHDRDFSQAVA